MSLHLPQVATLGKEAAYDKWHELLTFYAAKKLALERKQMQHLVSEEPSEDRWLQYKAMTDLVSPEED